jgi:hypothetical protein
MIRVERLRVPGGFQAVCLAREAGGSGRHAQPLLWVCAMGQGVTFV